MPKVTLSDLSNLQNEQSAIGTINANSDVLENAIENTLSRNGQTPNQMEADLDMNSNNIINLPHTLEDGNAISYGQVIDLIDSLENGAVITADFVTLSNHDDITNERVLTAGLNIGIVDAGPGSTVTVGISGDDLNAYEALSSTGLVARTGDGAVSTRTITGTANEVTLANGDGVSGNPTVSLPNALTFTGKTVTGGTFTGITVSPSSLTVPDNTFTIQDNSDATKQLQFQASGIATATTRTLTAPDANTTIAGTDATQTLTNKTIALGSNTVSGTTAQFNTALSDNDFATLAGAETLTNKTIALGSNTVSGTTAQFNTALSDNDFATLAGTETLTNKTLTSPTINTPTLVVNDASLSIRDNADGTKIAQFQSSGITTGTTRTFTFPDANTTLVGTDATQTLTNKTITSPTITVRDNVFTLQDQGDNTKQAQFELSGITTGNTRTMTLPDANATLVGTATTQTLTNKTLTSPTITSPVLTMGSDAQGDVLYHNGTQYVRLGPGTSGHFLKTNGAAANPAWAAVPGGGDMLAANNLSDVASVATSRSNLQAFKQTLLTPVTTTSGTSHDWTIPTGCKEFSVALSNVSQSSTSVPFLQLGDAGGIESSGYTGSTAVLINGVGVTAANHSSGIFFSAGTQANTNVQSGVIHFVLASSSTNLWCYHGTLGYSDALGVANLGGTKALSQELTTLRLACASSFDFGTVNVLYTSP
jgi:hypothetical protein